MLSRSAAPDSCNSSTPDIDPRGNDLLSLARVDPFSRHATTVIGQTPSLPMLIPDLAQQHGQGGQCLSCIVHRQCPAIATPPRSYRFSEWSPYRHPIHVPGFVNGYPVDQLLDETLPEEAVQGVVCLDGPLRSSTSLGTIRTWLVTLSLPDREAPL